MSYQSIKEKGIHHVCLKVSNLKETVDFYKQVLDARFVVEWGKDGQDDHAILLDIGHGDLLEIFESKNDYTEGSWQHLAVVTKNIEESINKAFEAGAVILNTPIFSDIPTRSGENVKMKFAFVKCPGGETLEFIEDVVE